MPTKPQTPAENFSKNLTVNETGMLLSELERHRQAENSAAGKRVELEAMDEEQLLALCALAGVRIAPTLHTNWRILNENGSYFFQIGYGAHSNYGTCKHAAVTALFHLYIGTPQTGTYSS